jgi:hypothetical protein
VLRLVRGVRRSDIVVRYVCLFVASALRTG